MTEQPAKPGRPLLRIVFTMTMCLGILGAAVAAMIVINQTEPTAQKSNSSRKSSALVDTVIVERDTYSPRLVVLGTVQAAQDIVLSPRVSGQVFEMSPKLVPGGMVHKDDLLLKIDPADFENALSISQSRLEQAEASREIEQARQRLAEKELKMLEGSIDNTNRALVMREPQIASIEAQVSAAKASVKRANLDLDRTSVYAPFDAQVLSRSVNIGSQVGPGDELGRLVGLEEYWVMATVPVRSLRWVQFPKRAAPDASESGPIDSDESSADRSDAAAREDIDAEAPLADEANDESESVGSSVILRNADVWGPGVERPARVSRMIGTLDSQTRLARILITVKDPLGLKSNEPPLIINSLLETEIVGQPIEDVVRLRREHVRDKDTVWVMENEKLTIRETEVVFRDIEFAYISAGLENGDEVVTSTLATVAAGIGLRRQTKNADTESPTVEVDEQETPPSAEVDVPADTPKSDSAGSGTPASEESENSGDERPEPSETDDSAESQSTDSTAVSSAESDVQQASDSEEESEEPVE